MWFADVKPEHFSIDPAGSKRLENNYRTYITAGTVTATPVIADILGNGKFQTIFCTESGEMLICDESGNLINKLKLEAPTETTPLIKDIDGDGFLEIVIASKTTNLYCYKTKSKGKVFIGQFRYDNQNSGVLEYAR